MYNEDTPKTSISPPSSKGLVLVVAQDKTQRETLGRGLFLYSFKCVGASTMEEARIFLSGSQNPAPDLLLIDISGFEGRGFEMIGSLLDIRPAMPVVALCGLDSQSERIEANEVRIIFLSRPFTPAALNDAVCQACGR